jgi:hypothetical protein
VWLAPSWHNAQSNAQHDAWQGKDRNKVVDNSKDENLVFDPGGSPRLAEFASMPDAGKAVLSLQFPAI